LIIGIKMNDRITLLAFQASDPKTGWLDRQKFAKLIVKECMEVASPNYMSTPEDSVYYVEQAIDRIAEHFGVEE
jgi:hypothetical protein